MMFIFYHYLVNTSNKTFKLQHTRSTTVITNTEGSDLHHTTTVMQILITTWWLVLVIKYSEVQRTIAPQMEINCVHWCKTPVKWLSHGRFKSGSSLKYVKLFVLLFSETFYWNSSITQSKIWNGEPIYDKTSQVMQQNTGWWWVSLWSK